MRHPSSRLTVAFVGITAIALAAAMVWLCLWITDEELWQSHPIGLLGLYPSRLLLLTGAELTLLVGFAFCVVRPKYSMKLKRLGSLAFAACFSVLLLEDAFMLIPRSHNVGYTLASRLWFHYYWKPINSLGYRGPEHEHVDGKKLVFAVGDSFTAGGGIAHIKDRYSDLLEARFPDLHVLNLGKNGADTAAEFANLQAHPLRPDAVVLQYYPNDIEGAAARAGWQQPKFAPYEDLTSVKVRFVVRSSFLANFLYWLTPHTDSLAYVRYLEKALHDEAVLKLHFEDLGKFCDYSENEHIPLFVVMFPILNDLSESRELTGRVKELLLQRHIPVVDVAALVENMPPSERTANNQDAHASPAVHALVADALGKLLEGDKRQH